MLQIVDFYESFNQELLNLIKPRRHRHKQDKVVGEMSTDGEPQSKFFVSITNQKDKGHYDNSVEGHTPVHWVQIAVNGHENDRSEQRSQVKLYARSKE